MPARLGAQAGRGGVAALLDRPWERPTAKDWAAVLAALPLFSRCRKRHLKNLAGLAQFKEFAPGDVVIQAGEPSDAFYLIVSGRARVLAKPKARMLRRGDYFGEMGLIDGEPDRPPSSPSTSFRRWSCRDARS